MQRIRDNQEKLLNEVIGGRRLLRSEALDLFQNAGLLELGQVANILRQRMHPDTSPVTFVIDRNVNYTNVCSCQCNFCAFYKQPGECEAYVLTYPEIKKKVEELQAINGTQLLLQGGLNPRLGVDYFLEVLKNLRHDFPGLSIHAFSPPEIAFIAANNNLLARQVLECFKEAGLSSLPGGGAEILTDRVRKVISPNKISSDEWLNVMEEAHKLSIPSSATMMAGSIESVEDIIDHLLKLRALQDKTKGFIAFIPWSFQSNNTKVQPLKLFTGQDYLRLIAISRIVLDNFKNIQVSWPTQGIKIAQIALAFGANDFGGIMMEENVIASTGLKINSSVEKVVNAIRALKRKPAQRNTGYQILRDY